jgi:hypothetical protein
MNVAAGQMARPSIASDFTTAARENQHPPGAGSAGPHRNAAIQAGGTFLNAE